MKSANGLSVASKRGDGELGFEVAGFVLFCSGVFAVQYVKTFGCSLALAMLILAGCSESPEVAAAKKIAKNVAQARELMKDQTTSSYEQAQKLLEQALAIKGSSIIGQQRANELLGALLSETTARDLNKLSDEVESFGDADLGLSRSLSELSGKAGAFAYAVGLQASDDENIQQYRKELLARIPAAEKARDEATATRKTLEQKLAAAKSTAFAVGVEADAILLEAAKASGPEQLSKTKEGSAKRLEADRLGIAVSGQELVVLRAQEDEIRRESELAGLQEGLAAVEKSIKDHMVAVGQTNLEKQKAQAVAEESAGQLLEQVEALNGLGSKLSAAYDRLIARQSKAVGCFRQALSGAVDQRKRFSQFKKDQPTEAEPDERVEILVGLDEEVGLAVSVARAQISLARLRERKIAVLNRVRSRVEQIKQLQKDLAVFGDKTSFAKAAMPSTAGGTLGFFRNLLSSSKKSPKADKPFTAMGLVMDSPSIDTTPIEASISQTYQAAWEDLNSAQRTLWTTTLDRLKSDSPPEAVVKELARAKWNWQILGMLGLVHEARAGIAQRMGRTEEAQADAQVATTYLAQSKKARAGVLR